MTVWPDGFVAITIKPGTVAVSGSGSRDAALGSFLESVTLEPLRRETEK